MLTFLYGIKLNDLNNRIYIHKYIALRVTAIQRVNYIVNNLLSLSILNI